MNPQELFIDVSSGRFLDGESTIPVPKPNIFSNEEKTLKINVLNVRRNSISRVNPSKNAKLKARIGTATAKLSEQQDAIATPILITAVGSVTTAPASAATGIGTADVFTTTTATVKASITSLPAVTATVVANIVYVPPVTASITCGIISQTTFPSVTLFEIPITENLQAINSDIDAMAKLTPSQESGVGLVLRVLDFPGVELNTPVQAIFSVTTSGSEINSITIATRGSGYPDGVFEVSFTGGSPSATASALATCSGGIVTTVSLVSGGVYSSVPCASLFTPHKSIKSITPTNFIGYEYNSDFSISGSIFRWVRGLTTVTQQRVPLSFSPPTESSSITPTRTPIAYLEHIPEPAQPLARTNFINSYGERGNLWRLVISDRGYGYSSAPSVSHGIAKVSSYVYGATYKFLGRARNQFFPGETGLSKEVYRFFARVEDFTEIPVNIGFKGCAVNSIFTSYSTKVEFFGGEASRYVFFETPYPAPYFNADGSPRYPDLRPVAGWFPTSAMEDSGTRISTGFQIEGVQDVAFFNFTKRPPFRTYKSSSRAGAYDVAGVLAQSKLADYFNYFFQRRQLVANSALASGVGRLPSYETTKIYNCSYATSSSSTKHNLIQITIPPAVTDVAYFENYSAGGLFDSKWQVLDYGENYEYVDGTFSPPKNARLVGVAEVLPGTVLKETFFNVSAATVPNTLANGFLPSNIGRQTTVATRAGARFTQTFIDVGGNMVYSQPNATATEIVVTYSGTVNTASVQNLPAPYVNGSYALTVQSPTAGTTAKMNLIIDQGTASVIILDGGSGYTSAPIVTAPSPNAKNGFVASAEITNIPFGYSEGRPYSLEVSDSPTTGGSAALSLVKNGDLYSVNINASGFGYTTSPSVTAPGPEKQNIGNVTNLVLQENPVGYLPNTNLSLQIQPSPDPEGQASGSLEVDSSGVAKVVINNPGFGYTSAPIVTAPGPNKISGRIVGATITTQGRGFPIGTYPCIVTTAPNGGETARISLVVESPISRRGPQAPNISLRVDSAGFGYVTNPIITTITPPGNAIAGITITCQGTFYENETATYEITDATGTGAAFGSVVVSQGKISLIPFVYGGGNYSNNPKISFGNPALPESEIIPDNQIFGRFDITAASANAILTTANNKDVVLEVYETDGTNEQVVVQGIVNLSKRVLE